MSTQPSSTWLFLAASLVLWISAPAGAHEPKARASPAPPAGVVHKSASAGDIDPAAAGAVRVVDAFGAAIRAVDLASAKAMLDPAVLILESGGAEHGRDEYMAEHAIADAAFLQAARQQVRFRRARAQGGLAWVATESIIDRDDRGKKATIVSTETMVLRQLGPDWKIIHIHWSSRQEKD